MQLIKLDATRSTNEFLKELWQNSQVEDGTTVWAIDQYGGRGQQGTTWSSEPGKNLTFSILKLFEGLQIQEQFILNMAVSISIYQTLDELGIPDVHIKWPNDILSGTEKICGILIENIVKSDQLKVAIIGIGINVNQVDFTDLPKASSMKLKGGKDYDLELVLDLLIAHLQSTIHELGADKFTELQRIYKNRMYRINRVSSFELPDGSKVNGIIRGISNQGELQVELEESVRTFNMKEIRLLN